MLFLFSYAGRIGYVQNILETLHLPYGTENMYEYTLKENELHGGAYIDEPALAAKAGEDVMVFFVDINPKSKTPYIPLRKARLVKFENEQDRMYYTVVLMEHCTPKIESLDNVQIMLKNEFGEKLYTRMNDAGKGYLVLYSDRLGFKEFDEIGANQSPWLTAVSRMSKLDKFKNCVFTMLTVSMQRMDKPLRRRVRRHGNTDYLLNIRKCGSLTYLFHINTAYCAELDYYVPFHDRTEGTVVSVQFCSSPNKDSLSGAMLEQKLNLEQGKVKFNFIASSVGDLGEIAFKVTDTTSKGAVYIAGRGARFFIKRSIRRYVAIVATFLVSFGLSLGSVFWKDASKEALGFWYYVNSTIFTMGMPLTAWLAAVLWNGRKK